MKQLMIMAISLFAKITESPDISIAVPNIITSGAMNKNGYTNLSRTRVHNASAMDGKISG